MCANRDANAQLHCVANAAFHCVANAAYGFHRFLKPSSALPSTEVLSRFGGGTTNVLSSTNASSSELNQDNRRTGE